MSTISSIRQRVEARVQSQLVMVVLQKAAIFHTRKGTRRLCDCDYCVQKNRWTARFVNHNFGPNIDYRNMMFDNLRDRARADLAGRRAQLLEDV